MAITKLFAEHEEERLLVVEGITKAGAKDKVNDMEDERDQFVECAFTAEDQIANGVWPEGYDAIFGKKKTTSKPSTRKSPAKKKKKTKKK